MPTAQQLTELADGVYAWVPSARGASFANAGVVVDGDGITVIDSLMVRSQWEPFAAAVAELDALVRRLVLTSSRIEHVGGTRAFSHAAVYASPYTSEVLDQPFPLDAYLAFMPTFADELEDLAEVGTRPATHVVDGAASLTPRVEVLPASGHTPGDLLVLVPDADVCFAGDLCSFGVTPLGFQGDLVAWVDMLDAVVELADTIVPGHGPVGGEAEVRELQAYLRACVAARGDVATLGAGPWERWAAREHDPINVQRAAMVASGDERIPPAMLRAMGRD